MLLIDIMQAQLKKKENLHQYSLTLTHHRGSLLHLLDLIRCSLAHLDTAVQTIKGIKSLSELLDKMLVKDMITKLI